MLVDTWSFHRHHHRFRKTFWQRAGPLHALDNRSDDARSDSTGLESLCQYFRHPLTGCRARAKDWAAARTSCENGEGADGSINRPQIRVLDFFAQWSDLHMHGCDIENESIFIFFRYNTHKRKWVLLNSSPNLIPCLEITCEDGWNVRQCENETGATIKIASIEDLLSQLFPDTRYKRKAYKIPQQYL